MDAEKSRDGQIGLPAREASSPLLVALVWLGLCAIWGSTWLAIKVGLGSLPPLTFAGIRFVIGAGVLFGGCFVAGIPILPTRRGDWAFLVGTGLLAFAINHGLLFWGEQSVSSGLAAVLQATIPCFGLLFAHGRLAGENLTARRLTGTLLGLAGVAAIFSHQFEAAGPKAFWGSLGIVLGAASVAFSNVLVKARGFHLPAASMAAWQMTFGLIPLLALGYATEGNPFALSWNPVAVACLLYLALVGSALAFVLFYWLMRRVAATKSMAIALVTPVVAVLLGWLFLSEPLSLWTLLGGAGVLAGTALVLVPGRLARVMPVPLCPPLLVQRKA